MEIQKKQRENILYTGTSKKEGCLLTSEARDCLIVQFAPRQLQINFGLNVIYNHCQMMNCKKWSMKKAKKFSNLEQGN